MMEFVSNSLEDTQEFAKKLAKKVKPKDVIALTGDLGAGKTAFTKAFAKELGVKSTVCSPTFTIFNIYDDGRIPLFHFDAYRLSGPDEMEQIGFDEFVYGDGVCVIEWADIVKDILPLDYISVKIEMLGENQRKFILEEVHG